jgi:hypothetical protein
MSNKDLLSPILLDWTILSEGVLNKAVRNGDAVYGPICVDLPNEMRPFQIAELEQYDTLVRDRKAVFEPHIAESGAVRFIFDRLE